MAPEPLRFVPQGVLSKSIYAQGVPRDGSAGGWWARRGVRQRSTIVAVLVVSFALALGGVALIVVLGHELTSSVSASVTQRTQDVAAQIGADDINAATPTINASTGDGTLIQIIDSTGAVVLSSPSIEGEPAMVSAGDLNGDPQILRVTLLFVDNAPYLVATVPVGASVGPVVVVGAQSLAQVQRVAQLVTLSLLIGSPLLLLAVGWVTCWAVGRSLSSVDRIRVRVEGIGAQDLAERVPVPPAQDEIAALAATMNHMLDRLEGSAITQRRFVADASHELKSPLASMRASLEGNPLVAACGRGPEHQMPHQRRRRHLLPGAR